MCAVSSTEPSVGRSVTCVLLAQPNPLAVGRSVRCVLLPPKDEAILGQSTFSYHWHPCKHHLSNYVHISEHTNEG